MAVLMHEHVSHLSSYLSKAQRTFGPRWHVFRFAVVWHICVSLRDTRSRGTQIDRNVADIPMITLRYRRLECLADPRSARILASRAWRLKRRSLFERINKDRQLEFGVSVQPWAWREERVALAVGSRSLITQRPDLGSGSCAFRRK